jgi:geranylgeranyl diphosphate synthase type II
MSSTSTTQPPPALLHAAALIEKELEKRVQDIDLPPNLKKAAHHAVLGGGKRVRPSLTLLCCEAVGGEANDALSAATAVEFVHCFSLVHDDLPALDDDAIRRGLPTLHIKAGEAMAVLAGDLLLAMAFEQIVADGSPDGRSAALTRLLTNATIHTVIGQVYDTVGGFPAHLDAEGQLDLMHRNKTGSLIQAACEMGAVCGSATESDKNAITAFGRAAGLMFQIVDDLIDIDGCPDLVGKAVGKDADMGKLTFPGVVGDKASRDAIETLRRVAADAIKSLNNRGEDLKTVTEWMAQRTH